MADLEYPVGQEVVFPTPHEDKWVAVKFTETVHNEIQRAIAACLFRDNVKPTVLLLNWLWRGFDDQRNSGFSEKCYEWSGRMIGTYGGIPVYLYPYLAFDNQVSFGCRGLSK